MTTRFLRGHRYEITSDYYNFKKGKVLTHVYPIWSVYDSLMGDVFHNPITGELERLELSEREYLELKPPTYFKDLGADMELKPIPAEDVTFAKKTDLTLLKPVADYLKKLAEGIEPIESWFDWANQNRHELGKALTKSDFLKFKFTPWANSGPILESLSIPFKLSHRYGWLDHCYENRDGGGFKKP